MGIKHYLESVHESAFRVCSGRLFRNVQARRLPAKRAPARGVPVAGGPDAAAHGRGGGADRAMLPLKMFAKEGHETVQFPAH